MGTYIGSREERSGFIEKHYVNPGEVEIEFPREKRNLIYIFWESMKTTYSNKSNGGSFEKNFISELTELAHNNENFSDEKMI